MRRLLLLALVGSVFGISSARADVTPTTVFTETFTQDTAQFPQWITNPNQGLNNTNFANWNVSRGNVDIKQVTGHPSPWFDHGVPLTYSMPFIDLDGTNNASGEITTKNALNLAPGTYQLKFDLGGNHGRDKKHGDGVTVKLGDLVNQHYELPWTEGMAERTIDFTVTTATSAYLSFSNDSPDAGSVNDNQGPLLGNIRLTGNFGSVQNVPEPSTFVIAGSFLAGMYLMRRKLKKA